MKFMKIEHNRCLGTADCCMHGCLASQAESLSWHGGQSMAASSKLDVSCKVSNP